MPLIEKLVTLVTHCTIQQTPLSANTYRYCWEIGQPVSIAGGRQMKLTITLNWRSCCQIRAKVLARCEVGQWTNKCTNQPDSSLVEFCCEVLSKHSLTLFNRYCSSVSFYHIVKFWCFNRAFIARNTRPSRHFFDFLPVDLTASKKTLTVGVQSISGPDCNSSLFWSTGNQCWKSE